MIIPRVWRVAALGLCVVVSANAQYRISVGDCQRIRLYRSVAGDDRLGHAVARAGDVTGDGFVDVLVGAPFYDSGKRPGKYDNGAVYLLMGSKLAVSPSSEIDLASLDDLGVMMVGAVGTQVGSTLAGLGDMNEDGFADIAIGAGLGHQAAVVFGSTAFPPTFQLNTGPVKSTILLNSGASVAAAGDVNGDGFLDAIFGNPYADLVMNKGKETYVGKVTVLFGSNSIPKTLDANDPGDAGFTIRGPGNELLGTSVCGVGDVNQDGFDDIALSAQAAGESHRGITYLVCGAAEQSAPTEYRLVVDNGGGDIARTGDVNNDGFGDFLICSNDYRALLVWGNSQIGGRVDLNSSVPPTVGVLFLGAATGAGGGDINGDGVPDIVFGLPYQSVNDLPAAGQVVVLFGGTSWPPVVDLLAPEVLHITIDGMVAQGGFGTSVAMIGDLDVDGYGDLVIGAPREGQTVDGESRAGGEVYILSGKYITRCLSEQAGPEPPRSP
ncbi:MAG: integrin alpha [bacterium]